jgi:hypothetical protein
LTRNETAAVRARPVWMTSVVDDYDHVVTDDDMSAGITSGSGTYRAMCGAEILPAPMSDAPCGRCSCCVATLRALHARHKRQAQAAQPRVRKRCLLSRALRRHR